MNIPEIPVDVLKHLPPSVDPDSFDWAWNDNVVPPHITITCSSLLPITIREARVIEDKVIDPSLVDPSDLGPEFTVENPCTGTVLNANESCSISAIYRPRTLGSNTAHVYIPYVFSDSQADEIQITFTGLGLRY
ncbi:MAG: hypothetical protein ACYDBJ_20660 [Aggregatilineales bacterium]